MSELEALFFANGSIPPLNPKVRDTYNRRAFRIHEARKEAAFTEFYLYCHALAKAE
jgi:hypothetical protein